MAGDRQTEFVVKFDGDDNNLGAFLNSLKTKVRGTVGELERTTSSLELFKGTQAKITETGAAFERLTAKVAEYREQIARIEAGGGKAGKELTDSLKQAERELAKTTREIEKQNATLAKLQATLTKAGVDTTRLADEEQRLAIATKEAARQQQILSAQQLLGVKSSKETADQIAKLNAAYNTLRANGATVSELAQAQRGLAQQTAELQRSTGGLMERFSAARGAILGFVGAIAGVAAAAKAASAEFIDYQERVTQLGAASTLAESELAVLGDGVKQLSTSLGFDLKEGLTATRDLLRQGLPAGNILELLAAADGAAKTGLTNLGTAAKLTGTLVRAFGVDVKSLQATLDGLFELSRSGGASFDELAAGLAELGPLAKRTGTPIEEVAAAIQVMVRAGLDAPTALSQLQQIMTRLANPQVVARLRELGIESGSLADTLRQIGDRGLAIGEILELGISSARAAAGVAALTEDATKLTAAIAKFRDAGGSIDEFNGRLDRLHVEAVQRLTAALEVLWIRIGEGVTPTTRTIDSLAQLVIALNHLTAASQKAAGEQTGLLNQTGQAAKLAATLANPIGRLRIALDFATEALRGYNSAMAEAGKASAQAIASVGDAEQQLATRNATARLQQIRTDLLALIPALQASSKQIAAFAQEAIAGIDQAANQQLAGLDKLRNAEAEIATKGVEITRKAAAERLAIIQQAAANAIKAVNLELDARLLAAGKDVNARKAAERDIATAQKEVLTQVVATYQAHLGKMIALETGHLNTIRELNQQRIAINQGIEDKIRDLRISGLSEYEKFGARVREIDVAISKARAALAEGDLKVAENFATRAIELTSGIGQKIEQDGRVVVTQLQGQELAVGKLKAAQEVLNGALDERVKAEEAGAKASRENIETAQSALTKLKGQLDELNAIVAKGLTIKVDTTAETAVAKARAEILSLDGLDTTSTHTVTVKRVEANAAGGVVGDAVRNARRASQGVRNVVERFAGGGTVFRRPLWTKVPGSGDGDTVPAALQAGSFVVRKAASRFYGDDLMRRVAHFATGGKVGTSQKSSIGGPTARDPGYFGIDDPAFRDTGQQIPPPTLPSDLNELLRLIDTYIREVFAAAGTIDGYGFWASAFEALANDQKRYQRTPTDENLEVVIRRIRGVGLNLGASKGQLLGFDIDGRRWHRTHGVNAPPGLASLGDSYEFYAGGGYAKGTDTVPAMLTPGEFVVRKSAVDKFGAGLLHAINGMRIPRDALARMMRGPQAPQRPRYFAEGGQVGAVRVGAGSAASPRAERDVVVNVNVTTAGKLTPDEVRRQIVPILRDEARRIR